VDTIEREDREGKRRPKDRHTDRQGEDRITLQITLLYLNKKE